MNQLFTAAPN